MERYYISARTPRFATLRTSVHRPVYTFAVRNALSASMEDPCGAPKPDNPRGLAELSSTKHQRGLVYQRWPFGRHKRMLFVQKTFARAPQE